MPDPSPSADTPNPSRCKARSRRSGGQCHAYPVRGATVCSAHGGRAPQVRVAAVRRQAQAAAEAAVVTYGLPRDVDPGDALLEEVRRTAGHVAWLAEHIRDLAPDALTWGRTEEVDKRSGEWPGVDTTHAAVPPVIVDLYLRERKHLVEVCRVTLAAGVEERHLRLAEQMGTEIAGVMRRVVARPELRLSPEQLALAPRLMLEELRAHLARVEGGPK